MAKNSLKAPKFVDHEIVTQEGKKVGEVRVTPSGVKWKAKGKQSWRSVSLPTFTKWIPV